MANLKDQNLRLITPKMPAFSDTYVGATKKDEKGAPVAHGHGCIVYSATEGAFGPTILCGSFKGGKPSGEMKSIETGITLPGHVQRRRRH